MNMTHYMELLATNQPWNLLAFMAVPVILAETVAITELYLLYTRRLDGWVRGVNRLCGLLVGVYFIGVIAYLLVTAVIPITRAGEWRTGIDVLAVGAYLIGGVPLVLIALLELGLLHGRLSAEQKLGWHAVYVALFLFLAHVAMISGMTDPALFGFAGTEHSSAMAMPAGQEVAMPADGHAHGNDGMN